MRLHSKECKWIIFSYLIIIVFKLFQVNNIIENNDASVCAYGFILCMYKKVAMIYIHLMFRLFVIIKKI